MRSTHISSIRRRAPVFLTGLSLLVMGGCSAQEIADFSGQDITKLASNSLTAITGQRTTDQLNAEIDTRPRSPLVMPPSAGLQPPGTPDQTTALLGDQWPDDPDIRAREQEKAARLAQEEKLEEDHRQSLIGAGRSKPLSVTELRSGARPSSGNNNNVQPDTSPSGAPLSPEELLNRRLDPEKAAERRAARQERQVAVHRTLTTPPGYYDAPSASEGASTVQEPEKKSMWERLQFWKRD